MAATRQTSSLDDPSLSSRAKSFLVAGLCLFFAIDNYHMWTEQDNFPFCSHGLFNGLFTTRSQLLRMVVHDDQGRSVIVDSGRVIPIEWFRTVGMAEDVLVRGTDRRRQEQLARLLLVRLNDDPWYGFDETYPSIRPNPGAKFIGLEVILIDFDLGRYQYGQILPPVDMQTAFSYWLPGSAAAHSGERR